MAGAEVTVIEAAAVFVPSVTEVAVGVTVVALLVKWKCLHQHKLLTSYSRKIGCPQLRTISEIPHIEAAHLIHERLEVL